MNDTIDICRVTGEITLDERGHLRPDDRRRGVARTCRHGVSEAEPVPQVHLREHRLRSAHPRPGLDPREMDEIVERSLRKAGLFNEVKDRLAGARHRSVRWPAAASVHRPRHSRKPEVI
jgi:phosphate transport system ATP-binding protein